MRTLDPARSRRRDHARIVSSPQMYHAAQSVDDRPEGCEHKPREDDIENPDVEPETEPRGTFGMRHFWHGPTLASFPRTRETLDGPPPRLSFVWRQNRLSLQTSERRYDRKTSWYLQTRTKREAQGAPGLPETRPHTMRARPHKRPADKNTAVPLRAVHKPQVGSPAPSCFCFSKLTEKCLRWRRICRWEDITNCPRRRKSWYGLGGHLPGGDCSHLLERRCGSESSQQCLDLSVLCRIRPLCAPKRTPWSRL